MGFFDALADLFFAKEFVVFFGLSSIVASVVFAFCADLSIFEPIPDSFFVTTGQVETEAKSISLVFQALDYASKKHRQSEISCQDSYVEHLISVGKFIAQEKAYNLDQLCAALLRDVTVDSDFTKKDLETNFNPRIAELVERYSQKNLSKRREEQQDLCCSSCYQKRLLSM